MNKRALSVKALTAMYNLCNVSLYFFSANEFPKHYDESNPAFIKGDGKWLFLTVVTLMSASLIVANQQSYDKRLAAWLPERLGCISLPQAEPCRGDVSRLTTANTVIASLYKSVVSSASLVALLVNIRCPVVLAWMVSVPVMMGNFFAQVGVLLEKRRPSAVQAVDSYPPLQRLARALIPSNSLQTHAYTFLYNLPNTVMYFNTLDAVPTKLNHHWNRLTESLSSPTAAFCFSFGLLSSFLFFFVTQRTYAREMASKLSSSASLSKPGSVSLYQAEKYLSVPAAMHKTCISSFTLFYLIQSLKDGVVSMGFAAAIAMLLFPGNLTATLAVFRNAEVTEVVGERSILLPYLL